MKTTHAEARARERYWYEILNANLNNVCLFLSEEEKKNARALSKKHYKENKDKKQKYYEENRDKNLKNRKEYYLNHKEEHNQYMKEYRINHSDEIKEKRIKNSEEHKQYVTNVIAIVVENIDFIINLSIYKAKNI